MVKTEAAYPTFEAAFAAWELHDCPSSSDVCGCTYRYPCPTCGEAQTVFGEEMDLLELYGGECMSCVYGGE